MAQSYSVNLSNDEWSFLLVELEARRDNDLEPAVNNGDHHVKPLLDTSHRITKKIENKQKPSKCKEYEKITKKQLFDENIQLKERCEMLERYCDKKDENTRDERTKRAKTERELETSKHQYRWLKETFDKRDKQNIELKKQIDIQHEEIQLIKNKLKDILSN